MEEGRIRSLNNSVKERSTKFPTNIIKNGSMTEKGVMEENKSWSGNVTIKDSLLENKC